MYTKTEIYNLALNHLLLKRSIVSADSDTSNEKLKLDRVWRPAFYSTLEDLDLDSTSTQRTLELIGTDPTDLWEYYYKYPDDCVYFRRIQTEHLKDNRYSHVQKRVGVFNGSKVIFSNKEDAIGEYVSKDTPLNALSASAGLCVSYKLAMLASSLVTGRGANSLRKTLKDDYILWKREAQEQDRNENYNFYDEAQESEFVDARLR